MKQYDHLSREQLVSRVEALRSRLGDAPVGPAPTWPLRGVSGKNISATVEAAGRLGIPEARLQEGLSFQLEEAGHPDEWVTWEEFGELLGRIGELEGEAGLARLGEQALESPLFRVVGIVAGALFAERDLYEWVTRLVFREGGLYFAGVEGRVESLGGRHLQIVYESWGAVFTRPFGLAMAGICRSAPRLVGRPPASVEMQVSPDRLVLDIRFATEPTLGETMRRRLGLDGPRLDSAELRRLYIELVEKNQQLSSNLEQLEASRTARREMESRLSQTRQMRVVGRFAGVVAHEFNNLLTVIINLADLVGARARDGSAAERAVTMLHDTAKRAAELTGGLRELGVIEPSEADAIDLRALTTDARPLLESLLGPTIELTIVDEGDALVSRIERAAAERVLVNLAVNAREAMQDGGSFSIALQAVELDAAFVERHPDAQPGAHVLIVLEDDGPGMPEAVRERVFEPFYSTKDGTPGSGLGLATVYSLVRSAGGTIWVDSAPGAGATFRIFLPRVTASASTPPPSPDESPAPADRRTILLIDDNEMVREISQRVLELAGYQVRVAVSGEDALGQVERGCRPALVVSDVVMPGLRGRPLAEALRAELGPVPILFISGWTQELLDGELGPRTEFLRKPFAPAELLRRVAALRSAAAQADADD